MREVLLFIHFSNCHSTHIFPHFTYQKIILIITLNKKNRLVIKWAWKGQYNQKPWPACNRWNKYGKADTLDAVDSALRRYKNVIFLLEGSSCWWLVIFNSCSGCERWRQEIIRKYYDSSFFFGSRALAAPITLLLSWNIFTGRKIRSLLTC